MSSKLSKTYSKAGPGADLRTFIEKRLILTLDSNRKIVGQLRGYDTFMNLVIDDCIEIMKNEKQRNLGTCFVRGSSVQSLEILDKIDVKY